jgi:beta-lactamase regulating signal transducer with metallopeptidase domain
MSTSILSWLVTYALHSTLFLGTAWLVTSRISFGARARETMWKMALVGGVVTASLPAIGPLGTFTLRWPATESVVEATDPVVGEVELFVLPLASAEQVLAAVPKATIGDPPPIAQAMEVDSTFDGVPWPVGLIASWFAIALGLGLVRGLRRQRFEREISDRVPVTDCTATALLDRVRYAAGVEKPVRLSSSTTLASPVALGGREICIPERALEELDRPLMEALFAHELAHIERRDPEWLIAVSAFESAFFFQPLNWIAARAIRAAAEEECDRAAVELVGEGRALARCLVEVASWVRRARPVAVPGMAEQGTRLEERVSRLIAAGDLVWSGGSRKLAALTIGVLAIAIACGGPKVRPVEEPDSTPGVALEDQVVEDRGVDRVVPQDPDIDVDDKPVTVDEDDAEKGKRSQRTREYVWIGPGDDPAFQFDVVVPPFEHLAEQLEGIEEWAKELEPLQMEDFHMPDIEIMEDLEELKELGFAFQAPGGGALQVFSGLGKHLRIQIRGDVEFEDGQLKSISPEGRFEVEDNRGEIKRRIEVTSTREGELVYEYEVDGEPHAFDDAGREWLAEIIEMVEKAEHRAVPGRIRIRRYDGDDERIEHDFEIRGPDRKEIEKRIEIHRRRLDDHRRELDEKLREMEPRIERELEHAEEHLRDRLEMLEQEVERLRQQLEELERDPEEGS